MLVHRIEGNLKAEIERRVSPADAEIGREVGVAELVIEKHITLFDS